MPGYYTWGNYYLDRMIYWKACALRSTRTEVRATGTGGSKLVE